MDLDVCIQKRVVYIMKKKISICKVSQISIVLTAVIAIILSALSIFSLKEFSTLQQTTEQYILCENAAKQLQDGSDYLTEQVRLYAATRQTQYRSLYFEEANTTKRREKALDALKEYFDGTYTFAALEKALECSEELMETEYYSMRLVTETSFQNPSTWPEEIRNVQLSDEDLKLSNSKKLEKANRIVCDDAYQNARTEITQNVSECMNGLITQTRNNQNRSSSIFSDLYMKLEAGILILVILLFAICVMIRRLIVKPLISYNEGVKRGEIFPVIGAEELQHLAGTYNKVYLENQETQRLIRHQAEHDALTQALNRGSFEKLLHIYETGDPPFALILIDVDIFKSVNDTYGHAVGDSILKKVTNQLKTAFRSIDYVCRIGGDEFSVIMVEMTSNLKYTIEEKINAVNAELAKAEDGLPAISLSVGVAFSDRQNPSDSIFKDADKALYHVKENGRNGCWFY